MPRARAPIDPAVLAARDAQALAQKRVLVYPPRTAHNREEQWMAIRMHAPEGAPAGYGRNKEAAKADLMAQMSELGEDSGWGTSNVYGSAEIDWFKHDSLEQPDNPATGSTFVGPSDAQNNPGIVPLEAAQPSADLVNPRNSVSSLVPRSTFEDEDEIEFDCWFKPGDRVVVDKTGAGGIVVSTDYQGDHWMVGVKLRNGRTRYYEMTELLGPIPQDNTTMPREASGPNKTVAAARRRMGGFPVREPRPDAFMDWLSGQAKAGVTFKSHEEAEAAYAQSGGKNESGGEDSNLAEARMQSGGTLNNDQSTIIFRMKEAGYEPIEGGAWTGERIRSAYAKIRIGDVVLVHEGNGTPVQVEITDKNKGERGKLSGKIYGTNRPTWFYGADVVGIYRNDQSVTESTLQGIPSSVTAAPDFQRWATDMDTQFSSRGTVIIRQDDPSAAKAYVQPTGAAQPDDTAVGTYTYPAGAVQESGKDTTISVLDTHDVTGTYNTFSGGYSLEFVCPATGAVMAYVDERDAYTGWYTSSDGTEAVKFANYNDAFKDFADLLPSRPTPVVRAAMRSAVEEFVNEKHENIREMSMNMPTLPQMLKAVKEWKADVLSACPGATFDNDSEDELLQIITTQDDGGMVSAWAPGGEAVESYLCVSYNEEDRPAIYAILDYEGAGTPKTYWTAGSTNRRERVMKHHKNEAKPTKSTMVLNLGEYIAGPDGGVMGDRLDVLLKINGLAGAMFDDVYTALQSLADGDLDNLYAKAIESGMPDPDAEEEEMTDLPPVGQPNPDAMMIAGDPEVQPAGPPGMITGDGMPPMERVGRARREAKIPEEKPNLRKVSDHEYRNKKATVYKDAEWGEYRVKFYRDGEYMQDADYHTDDKADAQDTAKSWIADAKNEAQRDARTAQDFIQGRVPSNDAKQWYVVDEKGKKVAGPMERPDARARVKDGQGILHASQLGESADTTIVSNNAAKKGEWMVLGANGRPIAAFQKDRAGNPIKVMYIDKGEKAAADKAMFGGGADSKSESASYTTIDNSALTSSWSQMGKAVSRFDTESRAASFAAANTNNISKLVALSDGTTHVAVFEEDAPILRKIGFKNISGASAALGERTARESLRRRVEAGGAGPKFRADVGPGDSVEWKDGGLILVATVVVDEDGSTSAGEGADPEEQYVGIVVRGFKDEDDQMLWQDEDDESGVVETASLLGIEGSSTSDYYDEIAKELGEEVVSSYQDQTGTHASTAPLGEAKAALWVVNPNQEEGSFVVRADNAQAAEDAVEESPELKTSVARGKTQTWDAWALERYNSLRDARNDDEWSYLKQMKVGDPPQIFYDTTLGVDGEDYLPSTGGVVKSRPPAEPDADQLQEFDSVITTALSNGKCVSLKYKTHTTVFSKVGRFSYGWQRTVRGHGMFDEEHDLEEIIKRLKYSLVDQADSQGKSWEQIFNSLKIMNDPAEIGSAIDQSDNDYQQFVTAFQQLSGQ
jgi:hypothetical protein